MAGALRTQSHFFKGKAYFSSGVFTFVKRSNVEISAVIMRSFCRFSFGVKFEQIEFTFSAHFTGITIHAKLVHCVDEITADVSDISVSVNGFKATEKTDNSS